MKYIMFIPKSLENIMQKERLFMGSSQAGLVERQRIRKIHLLAPGNEVGRSLGGIITARVDEAMASLLVSESWASSRHKADPLISYSVPSEDALLTFLIYNSYTKVIQIFISWLKMTLVFLIYIYCHSAFRADIFPVDKVRHICLLYYSWGFGPKSW